MKIMGDLFVVVREMALAAIPMDVLAVAGLCGSRMTDHTGDRGVGRFGIFARVQKGDFSPCQGLGLRPELSMTMEAHCLDFFGRLAFLGVNQPMAGHARLILS